MVNINFNGIAINFRIKVIELFFQIGFGKNFIGKDSVCLILGDNVFYGDGFQKLLTEKVLNTENNNVSGEVTEQKTTKTTDFWRNSLMIFTKFSLFQTYFVL